MQDYLYIVRIKNLKQIIHFIENDMLMHLYIALNAYNFSHAIFFC